MLRKASKTDRPILDQRLGEIRVALEQVSRNKLISDIQSLFDEDLRGFMQYNYLMVVIIRLYDYLRASIFQSNQSYEVVLGEHFKLFEEIRSMETVEEIKTWFLTAFDLVLKHENSKGSTYSKRVQETIHYVKHTYLMTCHLEKLQIFRCP